jgi:hypothetical protein
VRLIFTLALAAVAAATPLPSPSPSPTPTPTPIAKASPKPQYRHPSRGLSRVFETIRDSIAVLAAEYALRKQP